MLKLQHSGRQTSSTSTFSVQANEVKKCNDAVSKSW